jgi:hypothetical protein
MEIHLRHPRDVAEDGSLDGGDSHHQLNGTNNESFSRRILIIETCEIIESGFQVYRAFQFFIDLTRFRPL